LRSSILILLILIGTLNFASAQSFEELFYAGKLANAKHWLLTHKDSLPPDVYYHKHILLGYYLNEHELNRAYVDSLKKTPSYPNNIEAQFAAYMVLSKYYQYHIKRSKSILYASKAHELAHKTQNNVMFLLSYTQMAHALRGRCTPDEIIKRDNYEQQALTYLPLIDEDAYYFYKAKVLQALASIDVDLVMADQTNNEARQSALNKLNLSNAIIQKHHSKHPQIVHNYLLMGITYVQSDPDKAIELYQQAHPILREINDGTHGILLYLSASLNHLMDAAYEVKYHQTGNEKFLNQAIVWAKQNIDVDWYKLNYEGFHFHRRFIDHYNPPAEQRIAKLYLILYHRTGNANYLNFATKYIEYFRHKPIMQTGKNTRLYQSLPNLLKIENGELNAYQERQDYTTNLVTNPAQLSRFLNNNQVVVTYFTYLNQSKDSIFIFVQSIEKNKQEQFILTYPLQSIIYLSDSIYRAVEHNNAFSYQKHAYELYRMVFKPVVETFSPEIREVKIIQPAYIRTPICFEGLLVNKEGKDFAGFDYVFDHYNISYLTSFTHFVEHQQAPIKVNSVSIWSPDYSATNLAELTETDIITKHISHLFPSKIVKANNKAELTRKLFKGQILQVSAHASASFDDFERPRIYTGLKNDSVLLDIDIEPLSIESKLVVLAACKSSVGTVQHNGIIDGFSRATLSAGSGGTVSTLYNVQETITTEMLQLFYSHLYDGLNCSEALYETKKVLKSKYPNPKIWQAYVYTGSVQRFTSGYNYLGLTLFSICVLSFITLVVNLLKTKLY
jgi:CHAT domain-containing protein